MSWQGRYRWKRLFRSSLWISPVAGMVVALLLAPVIRWVDERTQWTLLGFGPDGAKAVIGALSSSLLTFVVFAFSILLLSVQVAGSQLSPRVIARVFETRLSRATLAAFVFSYIYSLAALGRVEGRVPQLPVLLVILSSLAGIALFIGLIQSASQDLRPISVLAAVAEDTRTVIEAVYPHPFVPGPGPERRTALDAAAPARAVRYFGRSSAVLACDVAGLVEIATRAGCVIELVPQVGDFLPTGEELFRLHGAGAGAVDEGRLLRAVALGPERTLEQDPAFGFRIIVDVASKALSPAINDPTTGALAIDQLEHLLHLLSTRQLSTGVATDAAGEERLRYRAPGWDDFVTLAVTEIRLYGATSPQVTRRLMAMLEHLLGVVPAERTRELEDELALLQRTIERSYADPEDRRRAAVADREGFGSRASGSVPRPAGASSPAPDAGKPAGPGDCTAGEGPA